MTNVQSVESLLQGQKIVPVVVIENKSQALGLAQALLDGGISVIEITLRNDFGLAAIEIVKQAFPEMLIVAGTVTVPQEMKDAVNAGAQGIVSPGITSSLVATAADLGVAYLPGVATSSDILLANENGINECKLFPATVVGGIGALKAFNGPFPKIRFCPTGGVGANNFKDFLALPNVMFVGGSWVTPSSMIRSEDWSSITELCHSATSSL